MAMTRRANSSLEGTLPGRGLAGCPAGSSTKASAPGAATHLRKKRSCSARSPVVSGAWRVEGLEGVAITSTAFGTVFDWFPYVLTVAVFLFAFSTMLTWAYYGAKAATYLTGERRWVTNSYILLYLVAAIVACTMDLSQLINLSDGLIFLMAIPNLIGVYLLLPVVREEVDGYFAKLKSGEIRPTAG